MLFRERSNGLAVAINKELRPLYLSKNLSIGLLRIIHIFHRVTMVKMATVAVIA